VSIVVYTLNSIGWAVVGWFAAVLNYRLKWLIRLWEAVARRDGHDDET
jgi:hypothetical protein